MPTLPVTFSLEPRFKEQFASFLTQGFSAFIAAMKIWPNDPGLASQVANSWPSDPYVTAYQDKIKDDAAAALKPASKDAQIKRIEDKLSRMTDDNYLKAERLLAELSGHIDKPVPAAVNIDNRQQVIERVMVVRDYGEQEHWEDKLSRQQAKLIEHNE